jgi:hypothetical protein
MERVQLLLPALGNGDLWALTTPSGLGIVLVSVLVGGGLVAALWSLLTGDEDDDDPPAPPRVRAALTPVERELDAIAQARSRLAAEMSRAVGPLRVAFDSLIERPLAAFEGRVEALVEAARDAGSPDRDPEDARLDAEGARLAAALEEEDDARAQSLLAASARDVEETRRARRAVRQNARLALLELGRMRTLLESLPARVQDLSRRQSLQGVPGDDVEALARQLEAAVSDTSQVLDDLRDPDLLTLHEEPLAPRTPARR